MKKITIIAPFLVLLNACGGGGDESPSGSGLNSNEFTVDLISVDIRTVSNSESIDVDTSIIVSDILIINH